MRLLLGVIFIQSLTQLIDAIRSMLRSAEKLIKANKNTLKWPCKMDTKKAPLCLVLAENKSSFFYKINFFSGRTAILVALFSFMF